MCQTNSNPTPKQLAQQFASDNNFVITITELGGRKYEYKAAHKNNGREVIARSWGALLQRMEETRTIPGAKARAAKLLDAIPKTTGVNWPTPKKVILRPEPYSPEWIKRHPWVTYFNDVVLTREVCRQDAVTAIRRFWNARKREEHKLAKQRPDLVPYYFPKGSVNICYEPA